MRRASEGPLHQEDLGDWAGGSGLEFGRTGVGHNLVVLFSPPEGVMVKVYYQPW
jgi:hypothetical protein